MDNRNQFLVRLWRAVKGSEKAEDTEAFEEVFEVIGNDTTPEFIDELSGADRKALQTKMLRNIDDLIAQQERMNSETRRTFVFQPWLRVAAAMLLLVTAGFVVQLLFPQLGERITLVEQTMPAGQSGKIELHDGTVVSLNSGSTIRYSRWFLGRDRNVWLTGEAFFKVKRNEDKPFVVQTGDVKTTVLGTSFNIKSYAELEQTTISVATGKVRISQEEQQLSLLTANQEITVTGPGVYTVDPKVDMNARLAWREGKLVFDNYSMREVATVLGNYYQVEFIFMDSALAHTPITGRFDKGTPLVKVLDAMSFIKRFTYEIDNETVRLKSKQPGPGK